MAKHHDHDHDDHDHDHDVAPAKASKHHGSSHGRPAAPPATTRDAEDPNWWTPYAVLSTLVVFGVLGFFGAFNQWLRPLFHKGDAHGAASASASAASPAKPPTAPPALPTAAAAPETYGAKHLVVQWKGSARSQQSRSKEEAKARTEEALKKLKDGSKFEEIVGEYSDEPNAGARGGDLGKFRKGAMDPAFTAAVEKLKVGETSGVVESAFGYHIIVRTF
jgi:hypothetical protein